MSISASTLALFILLVPGLVFRFSLYHRQLVTRALGGNTIYVSIEVILYSVAIHLVFAMVVSVLSWFVLNFHWADIPSLYEEGGELTVAWPGLLLYPTALINFLIRFPIAAVIYFGFVVLLASALARLTQWVSRRNAGVAHMLAGPVAPLVWNKPNDTPVILCYVLTKVEGTGKRLMYQGIPTEISLGEGNSIQHVVLENPEKFYLEMDHDGAPKTTRDSARQISSGHDGDSFLYLDGSKIENVHFEGYYFNRPSELPSDLEAPTP